VNLGGLPVTGHATGIAGAMQVATCYGIAERQQVLGFATPTFEVRFCPSIADAMTLPMLSMQQVG
jgi:hypothetical protein